MEKSFLRRVLPVYLGIVIVSTALFLGIVALGTQAQTTWASRTVFASAGLVFIGLTWGATIWVVRRVSTPLQHMQEAAAHFAEGDLDFRLSVPEPEEVRKLAQELSRMALQLKARIGTVERQRGELAGILSSMVEGVIVLDAARRIRSANDAAAQLAQMDTSQITGRSLLDVFRSTKLAEIADEAAVSAHAVERTITVYREEPRYIQVHGSTLRSKADPRPGLLLVMHDVTQLRRLEQIRSDFVANVSHELKTPVTTIKGFLETVLDTDGPDPEDSRRFLQIVLQNANRLHSIIEDLLSLSRLEQAEAEIPFEPASLHHIAQRVAAAYKSTADNRRVQIQFSSRGECNAHVSANLVEQALSNLVSNAVKYSGEGATIQIRVEDDGETCRMSVQDNGPGIPPQALPRIFERFYRVDRARSRAMGGTGLGLAIVKHIALSHGGTVDVQSTVGQGSTFTLLLPKRAPAGRHAPSDSVVTTAPH